MTPQPNDRGAFFALGGVIPPADAPRKDPVLPRAEDEPFARFRFVMGPQRGWLFPIGHFSLAWCRISPDHGRWAIGDVVMHDDDHCEAAFALLTAGARAAAVRNLRRWAAQDDWVLDIAEGTRPLRPVRKASWSNIVCTRCEATWHHSAVAMPYRRLISSHSTRCGACGRGRRLPALEPRN